MTAQLYAQLYAHYTALLAACACTGYPCASWGAVNTGAEHWGYHCSAEADAHLLANSLLANLAQLMCNLQHRRSVTLLVDKAFPVDETLLCLAGLNDGPDLPDCFSSFSSCCLWRILSILPRMSRRRNWNYLSSSCGVLDDAINFL